MSKIFNNAKKIQNISGNPNLIINGNFNIWQRGTSQSSTGYNADRWVGIINGGAVFSKINAINLRNSSFALRAATTSAASWFEIKQIIETSNVIFVRGKKVVLSFYAKIPETYKGESNTWNCNLRAYAEYTDDLSDSIIGSVEVENSVYETPLSYEWVRHQVSFDIPDDAQTLSINFRPSNIVSLPENAVVDITQVKLELGDVATNYDDLLYTDELRKCQRYYQKIDVDFEAGSQNNQQFGITIPLNSEIRTTNPTIKYETQNNRGLNNIIASINSNKQSIKIKGNSTSTNALLNTSLSIDNEVPYGDVPSPVADVQTLRNNDVLTVFWTPPNDNGLPINNYVVQYGNSSTSLTGTLTTTVPSGNIEDISIYSTYYLSIIAINAMGASSGSNIYVSGPVSSVPGSPYNLSASWGFNNHYLSWSAPTEDGNSAIRSYVIQRATNTDFTQNLFSVMLPTSELPDTSITLANPTSSNNYYLRVAAINNAGTGIYSDSVFLQRTAPSAPINLSTSSINSGVILSWSAPSGNGGSAISGYIVNHSATSGFISSVISNIGLSSTTTIGSLANGSARYFRISAVNAIGSGAWSSIVSSIPNQAPVTGQPPINIVATWIDPTLIGVKFDNPQNNGGSPILNYNIQISSSSGFNTNLTNFNTLSANTQQFFSVPIATGSTISRYYIRACSNNAAGSGAYSSSIFLNKGLPPPPIALSVTPGDRSLTLRWGAAISSGIPITGYAIERSVSNLFTGSTNINVPISTINTYTQTITGLTNSTRYYIRMRSICASGSGPNSATVSTVPIQPATEPSVPVHFLVERINPTGVKIHFHGSSNNGGSLISHYTLAYATGLSVANPPSATTYFANYPTGIVFIPASMAQRNMNITIPYNSGMFTAMRATNAVGNSAWTNLVYTDMYLTNPSIVTGVSYGENVSTIGSGIGTISWKDPSSWGGENNNTYKTYNITVYCADKFSRRSLRQLYSLTALEYNNSINNTITVSGLVPGKPHLAHITAKNRKYSSSLSSLYFTPTALVKPETGGWTLSVPTPITDSTVNRYDSWDYFRGYTSALNMDNDNRKDKNNIWVSLEMYKTAVTKFQGSYLRYSNAARASDDGLWIKAAFPSNGVYVSLVQYATPLPGIYIPSDFTGYSSSKIILTETLAINSLNGALLQYSTDDINWTTATTLSVSDTSTIYTYKLGNYPIFCKYIRIYIPYSTTNFAKRLAVGLLNFA